MKWCVLVRVCQALHYLDPRHEIFKPGQVLAWHPALDRTTKTLRRLLCHPQVCSCPILTRVYVRNRTAKARAHV